MAIKVSVCVTTYNLERYIKETLDSIFAQKTNFDYEVLIGDDASTDRTVEILTAFKNKYPDKIKLILHSSNIGVNRNDYSLISHASGKYIAWCDGDDVWIDRFKLQKQVDILDNEIKFSCVHTSWKNFYESENKYEDNYIKQYEWEKNTYGSGYILNLLLGLDSGIRYSSIVFRAEIVKKFIAANEEVWTSLPHKQNDFAIFCALADSAPFYALEDITTLYRIRNESLSMTKTECKKGYYQLSGIHLTCYFLKLYQYMHKDIQQVLRGKVGYMLQIMLERGVCLDRREEVESLCVSVGYKYSIGQQLMRIGIEHDRIGKVVRHIINLKNKLQTCQILRCFR